MVFNQIEGQLQKKKLFALLIDPEKYQGSRFYALMNALENSSVDIILVGGSLVSDFLDSYIQEIKKYTSIPVIIFPGSLLQVSTKADALLFISLISGRNPEYLIGNHVLAAPMLKKRNIEVISTGYILLEGGVTTSVEYVSNTKPIPVYKTDLAVATAIAGEMIGHKMIYLESGSGAINAANQEVIAEVKKNISVPLIVGGGIKSKNDMLLAYKAGADIVVVGNIIEENLNKLNHLSEAVCEING